MYIYRVHPRCITV